MRAKTRRRHKRDQPVKIHCYDGCSVRGGNYRSLVSLRRKVLQERTARELLSEVVALVSLQEGWLLQGDGSRTAK